VLFAWLGVVPYLTSAAVRSTLGYIARVTTAAGGVVFDYALAPETLSPTQRLVYDGLAARVRAAGEPFQSGFTPEALLTDLRQLGFAVAEDLTPDALNARYLSQRSDGLRVGSLAHLMWAGPVRHAT
jgi:O-methyltransferase involved in polyketide biosynthesis